MKGPVYNYKSQTWDRIDTSTDVLVGYNMDGHEIRITQAGTRYEYRSDKTYRSLS